MRSRHPPLPPSQEGNLAALPQQHYPELMLHKSKNHAISEAVKDIELATRVNMRLQGIAYKKLYDRWIKREAKELIAAYEHFERKRLLNRRKIQEEEVVLLMLQ